MYILYIYLNIVYTLTVQTELNVCGDCSCAGVNWVVIARSAAESWLLLKNCFCSVLSSGLPDGYNSAGKRITCTLFCVVALKMVLR